MRQPSLRPYLAVGVVGFVLAAGCTRCACRSGATHVEASVPAVPTPRPIVVGPSLQAAVAVEPPPVANAPAPMAPVEEAAPLTPPAVSGPFPAAANATPAPDQDVVQSSHDLPPFPELKQELARRLPALQQGDAGGAAHAPDYGWLTGELQYVAVRRVWRLRYAAGDDEDRYGGSVTLLEAGALRESDSGKRVRVEGQLVDPDSREPSPVYRVRTLQILSSR
jgi:hypothetical protein